MEKLILNSKNTLLNRNQMRTIIGGIKNSLDEGGSQCGADCTPTSCMVADGPCKTCSHHPSANVYRCT